MKFDETYTKEYIIEILKGMCEVDEDGCTYLIDHNIALGMAIQAIEEVEGE